MINASLQEVRWKTVFFWCALFYVWYTFGYWAELVADWIGA